MKLLVPLYIYPVRDGVLAPEWQMMIDAQKGGVPVVAVANPGSGPGTEGDRASYEKGMAALRDGGVEVIGYIATGYGKVEEGEVKLQVDRYKEWYGDWLTGIFMDETAHAADDLHDGDRINCAKYRGYNSYVMKCFGDSATMVMNTGTIITEGTLTGAVGNGVIWNVLENSREYMEKTFGKVVIPAPAAKKRLLCWRKGPKEKRTPVEGTPPPAPEHVKGRAAFMVHGAPDLSIEDLCHWVNQLRRGGWTYVYMTDMFFDPEANDPVLHNPWDRLPTYWDGLVKAVGATL